VTHYFVGFINLIRGNNLSHFKNKFTWNVRWNKCGYRICHNLIKQTKFNQLVKICNHKNYEKGSGEKMERNQQQNES